MAWTGLLSSIPQKFDGLSTKLDDAGANNVATVRAVASGDAARVVGHLGVDTDEDGSTAFVAALSEAETGGTTVSSAGAAAAGGDEQVTAAVDLIALIDRQDAELIATGSTTAIAEADGAGLSTIGSAVGTGEAAAVEVAAEAGVDAQGAEAVAEGSATAEVEADASAGGVATAISSTDAAATGVDVVTVQEPDGGYAYDVGETAFALATTDVYPAGARFADVAEADIAVTWMDVDWAI